MIFTGTITKNDDGTTTFRQDGRVIARGKVVRIKGGAAGLDAYIQQRAAELDAETEENK